jgi:hypothetical protein
MAKDRDDTGEAIPGYGPRPALLAFMEETVEGWYL